MSKAKNNIYFKVLPALIIFCILLVFPVSATTVSNVGSCTYDNLFTLAVFNQDVADPSGYADYIQSTSESTFMNGFRNTDGVYYLQGGSTPSYCMGGVTYGVDIDYSNPDCTYSSCQKDNYFCCYDDGGGSNCDGASTGQCYATIPISFGDNKITLTENRENVNDRYDGITMGGYLYISGDPGVAKLLVGARTGATESVQAWGSVDIFQIWTPDVALGGYNVKRQEYIFRNPWSSTTFLHSTASDNSNSNTCWVYDSSTYTCVSASDGKDLSDGIYAMAIGMDSSSGYNKNDNSYNRIWPIAGFPPASNIAGRSPPLINNNPSNFYAISYRMLTGPEIVQYFPRDVVEKTFCRAAGYPDYNGYCCGNDGAGDNNLVIGSYTCKMNCQGQSWTWLSNSATEACNGVDDDCNGAVDDIPATSCGSCGGVTTCSGNTAICSISTPANYGAACDGGDSDSCNEGTINCAGACTDASGSTVESCTGGADEDCDGLVDCADPDCASYNSGNACGSCGTMICSSGSYVCSASTPANYGAACDGGDSDSCNEGTINCAGACTDASGSTVESCTGGADEDCDGLVDCADSDCSSYNPGVTACDGGDADFCASGTLTCGGVCSDDAASSTETSAAQCADGVDNDCDGFTDYSESECCTTFSTAKSYFEIRDPSNNVLARINQDGKFWIKGQVKTWANPTSSRDFVVQDNAGNPVLWINYLNGDLYIKGSIYQNRADNPSASGNFVIEDSTNNARAWITNAGSVYLDSCMGTGKSFS